MHFEVLSVKYQQLYSALCINGLVQDCSICIVNTMEILQSCTKLYVNETWSPTQPVCLGLNVSIKYALKRCQESFPPGL